LPLIFFTTIKMNYWNLEKNEGQYTW
jgi:hypothetical protein